MASHFCYPGRELDSLVEARNYYATILKYFRPYVGARVVEVGAGIGTFSNFLLGLESIKELTALEISANLFPILSRRFAADSRVKCINGHLHHDLPAGKLTP